LVVGGTLFIPGFYVCDEDGGVGCVHVIIIVVVVVVALVVVVGVVVAILVSWVFAVVATSVLVVWRIAAWLVSWGRVAFAVIRIVGAFSGVVVGCRGR
jgi:hypothetical protein